MIKAAVLLYGWGAATPKTPLSLLGAPGPPDPGWGGGSPSTKGSGEREPPKNERGVWGAAAPHWPMLSHTFSILGSPRADRKSSMFRVLDAKKTKVSGRSPDPHKIEKDH